MSGAIEEIASRMLAVTRTLSVTVSFEMGRTDGPTDCVLSIGSAVFADPFERTVGVASRANGNAVMDVTFTCATPHPPAHM